MQGIVRAGQGQLKYNWSNVCMHYFTREFLETAARRLQADGQYHIARKKIPSVDGPVQVWPSLTNPAAPLACIGDLTYCTGPKGSACQLQRAYPSVKYDARSCIMPLPVLHRA